MVQIQERLGKKGVKPSSRVFIDKEKALVKIKLPYWLAKENNIPQKIWYKFVDDTKNAIKVLPYYRKNNKAIVGKKIWIPISQLDIYEIQDLTDYSYETILNMVKEWGK